MRALAVADVYEALTAERPYRAPLPVEQALDIVAWEVPGRLDRGAFGALETYLGRGADPLPPGVLTLGPPVGGAGRGRAQCWVSTRSIRPYSTAWSALKKRSRSMSACTRSSGWPVCFA